MDFMSVLGAIVVKDIIRGLTVGVMSHVQRCN